MSAAQHERAGQGAPEVSVPAGQSGGGPIRLGARTSRMFRCREGARACAWCALVFAQGPGAGGCPTRVGLCLDALAMAVRQSGRLPEVLHADQNSQFTGQQ